MTLYVLRHAIAENARPGQADSARKLTEPGRTKARRVLAHAESIGVRPHAVLTSPYPRAAQTAALACEELRLSATPLESQLLVPSASVFDLWAGLRDYTSWADLLVVGHNPQLSSLVAWMLGARPEAFWLKKSGLAALKVDSATAHPRAALTWLLTPKAVGV